MSGHARSVPLLVGDGGWLLFWLQCHQALIGAPSPMQANQPWYPTVIFPTTSPGALAAPAFTANAVPRPPAAASAEPATADRSTVRREIVMMLLCRVWTD